MSTPQNDAFNLRAPKPIDDRYLENGLTPWGSVGAVNAGIPSAYRYRGLTVLIGNTEYWYLNGIGDGNLSPKGQSNNSVNLSMSADGFYTFPIGVLVIALVVTPAAVINFKAGSSPGAEDFVPTLQLPSGVPTAISLFLPRNTGQNIYFGGISGSSASVVIKYL